MPAPPEPDPDPVPVPAPGPGAAGPPGAAPEAARQFAAWLACLADLAQAMTPASPCKTPGAPPPMIGA
jgi:hypothetical protein